MKKGLIILIMCFTLCFVGCGKKVETLSTSDYTFKLGESVSTFLMEIEKVDTLYDDYNSDNIESEISMVKTTKELVTNYKNSLCEFGADDESLNLIHKEYITALDKSLKLTDEAIPLLEKGDTEAAYEILDEMFDQVFEDDSKYFQIEDYLRNQGITIPID